MTASAEEEPLEVFLKSDWGTLAKIARRFHFKADDFTKKEFPLAMGGGGTLEHNSSKLTFSFRRESPTAGAWIVRYSTAAIRRQAIEQHRYPAKTLKLLLNHFEGWTEELYHYLEDLREENESPHPWDDFGEVFEPPSPSASARIWQDDDVLKPDEVQDFRERTEAAFAEIRARQLLQEKKFEELREFVEEVMPQVGQKWGTWRQHFLGALVSRIVDGVTSTEVIGFLFRAVNGFLSASYHLPQLLPPTGP